MTSPSEPSPPREDTRSAGVDQTPENHAEASLNESSRDAFPADETLLESYKPGAVGDIVIVAEIDKKAWIVPEQFGRYHIEKELGRGGMGAVYLAHDLQLDRRVALKIPLIDTSLESDAVERFYREARAMATLQHANLCPVFDVGQFESWHFMTMAYIHGEPLSRKLKAPGGLCLAEGLTILRTVALALQKAHDAGVVHRDLKPANIMLTTDLDPIIMDFGLARLSKNGESELTHSGAVMGSPAYMAPEQVEARHAEIGPATDVYSLGVILYQIITGRRPFEGSAASIFGQIVSRAPEPPSQLVDRLPADFDRICLKALSKSPADRFQTAAIFANELQKLMPFCETLSPTQFAPAEAKTESAVIDRSVLLDTRADSVSRSWRDAELRQVTVAHFNFEVDENSHPSSSSSHSEILHDQSQLFATFVSGQIAKFGGVTVSGSGQEVIACFGFPHAFEDASQRAVRAALQAMRDVSGSGGGTENLPSPNQTWVTIHSGEAIAEQSSESNPSEISLIGEARSTASRLNAIVEPGTVAISAATYQRVALYFECESLGIQRVRGISHPVELFRVIREEASRNRVELVDPGNLTPLIGRDTELTILKDRWEQALDDMGQLVLLIGEAGLGKSRLIRELREHVIQEDSDEAAIIELRCSQYHQGTSYFPIVEYFSHLLNFENHSAAERLEVLVSYLSKLKLETSGDVAILCALLNVPTDTRFPPLNLSPQKLKERTEEFLLHWLRQLATFRPVLFIIEDLHWLDLSTLQFLEKFVSEFESGRLLSLFTFRPEFETPWKSKPHQTQIALNRLTKRQVGEMMRKRTNRRDIPESILKQMIERTDGIPLFIEEFTVVIIESGILDCADNSADDSTLLNVIPSTLHDLLLTRLDRMAANREVIQLAATIGREFRIRLLASCSTLPEAELQRELGKLIKAEIIFQKGQGNSAVYIFKHALLQDAAYRSMLTKKRQACHQHIGEIIEAEFPEIVATQPELLAQHFSEAGARDKAIQYWLRAGTRSQEQSANLEAIRQFERGLTLVMSQPPSLERDVLEMTFKLPQSAVLMAAKGYSAPEVVPLHDRCIEICRKLGESGPLFPVLIGKWGWNFIASRFDECDVRCREVIALAEEKRGPGMIAEAHWTQLCTSFFAGDFQKAREHADIGLAHYDEEASVEFMKITQQGCGPLMLSFLGMTLWKLGYPDQGRQRLDEAFQMCADLDHPFTLTVITWENGQYYDFARMGEAALQEGVKTVALAEELAAPFYQGLGLGCQGDGHIRLGRFAEAIPLLERCLAMTKLVGAKCTLGKYSGSLAEAFWHVGRRDEAWKMLDAAFEHIQSGERHMEAELLRYRGDFLMDTGELEQAEAAYRASLAVAARQQAKSYELRTTMRLCQLWAGQGRAAEALEELSKVYNWFSEGFSTPDLVEARELLDQYNISANRDH